MISIEFIFVDFDKLLGKFIYLFSIFLGNYFMLTMPSMYGIVVLIVYSGVSNLNLGNKLS